MDEPRNTLGIVVGGGPAPGINGVISAATIEARNSGWQVLGILDGFRWLSAGRTDMVRPLEVSQVSRIHTTGGSILRTSRENPTKSEEKMRNVIASLRKLGIGYLVTIGGDDTAFTATKVSEASGGDIRVAHVPKTIDNDLPIPGGFSTFGFQTARHHGVSIVERLMVDAETSSRWYLVVTMGRKAGHLALGIGKAAGATVTLIPEEFGAGPVRLSRIVDLLEGSMIKRLANGREDGVAVLAEGLAELLDPSDLEYIKDVERDPHGHVRLAEIPLGTILKRAVRERLASRGIKVTVVEKDVGYELRCASPIPFDEEYTRDLGHGAVRCLMDGQSGIMITRTESNMTPIPLSEIQDPKTGRTRVRVVDTESDGYRVARYYQIRILPEDLQDEAKARKIAEAGKTTVEDLRKRFSAAT